MRNEQQIPLAALNNVPFWFVLGNAGKDGLYAEQMLERFSNGLAAHRQAGCVGKRSDCACSDTTETILAEDAVHVSVSGTTLKDCIYKTVLAYPPCLISQAVNLLNTKA